MKVFFEKNIDKASGRVLYSIYNPDYHERSIRMTLCEELYFEITLTGTKPELKKFINFLRSGELDDFFEFSTEYISYDDSYADASDVQETSITLSTDDYGIEIEEIDTDEFLDLFCRASRNLLVVGQLYDIDDEEFNFVSEKGSSDYVNSRDVRHFNQDDIMPKDEEE